MRRLPKPVPKKEDTLDALRMFAEEVRKAQASFLRQYGECDYRDERHATYVAFECRIRKSVAVLDTDGVTSTPGDK